MKIAVALPFYNEEERIIKTLSSFLHKPFSKNLVFVLIDNNSTDTSNQLIRRFANRHSSIKTIIKKELRKGVIFARKKALDMALYLNPSIIVGTDADTVFNKDILREILNFAKGKKNDVFAGRGTIDSQTRLERLILLPEFVKLTKLLWNKEFELFGPYFFGACFALKTSFYKKVSPYFDTEKSLIIKDGGGEDLLLARRAYYMGAKFIRSKSKVITSSRRYQKDPLSWMTAKRRNFRGKRKAADSNLREYVDKNQKSIIRDRIKNVLDRWIRTALDADMFYLSTGKKYDRAMIAVGNFCNFFDIPTRDIDSSQQNPIKMYRQLAKKHQLRAEKVLLDFVRQRIKFQ